jgi:RNA polymerase sigma-70 factor (ECF subfamily)
MTRQGPDTDHLLAEARRGEASARSALLERHRNRLRRMVLVRLDTRLAARVDPSDVVQDVLLEADQKLGDYLQKRPLPFYPWLRQIAKDRLIELHRHHVRAQKRTVLREEPLALGLSDESLHQLFKRFAASGSSPSARLLRKEAREQIQFALTRLSEPDREILILRHLEKMSAAEIAGVLGIKEGAVHTRQLRALQRLGKLLGHHEN